MTLAEFQNIEAGLGPPLHKIITEGTEQAPVKLEAFWSPVYDRRAEDCVYGNDKGNLTPLTLCRIEANSSYLIYRVRSMKYTIQDYGYNFSWIRQNYFFDTDYFRIKQNHDSLTTFANLIALKAPTLVAKDKVTYEHINTVEFALFELERLLTYLEMSVPACGVALCGGDYL